MKIHWENVFFCFFFNINYVSKMKESQNGGQKEKSLKFLIVNWFFLISFSASLLRATTSVYEVWSTNNRKSQISWVTYVRFLHFFFCYVGTRGCVICWQYNFDNISLFLTDKKVNSVLVCSSIFLLFVKMYQIKLY